MLDPLLDNIEEETGYPVENNMVDSYAAQVEAMREISSTSPASRPVQCRSQ